MMYIMYVHYMIDSIICQIRLDQTWTMQIAPGCFTGRHCNSNNTIGCSFPSFQHRNHSLWIGGSAGCHFILCSLGQSGGTQQTVNYTYTQRPSNYNVNISRRNYKVAGSNLLTVVGQRRAITFCSHCKPFAVRATLAPLVD